MLNIGKIYFYLKIILVININGMELFNRVFSDQVYIKDLLPHINGQALPIINKLNIDLTLEQKEFLQNTKKYYENNKGRSKNDDVNFERTLFYQLINFKYGLTAQGAEVFKEYSGYLFFSEIKSFAHNNFLIQKGRAFNGLLCKLVDNSRRNLLLFRMSTKNPNFNIGLNIAKATYKIHLSPTKETILHTVVALFQLLHENPKIHDEYYIKDLIVNVKIKIDLEKNDPSEKIMPIIVMYIPNIFINDIYKNVDEALKNEFKNIFYSNNLLAFVCYKKAKNCAEILLSYLVYFFNQHSECKGSGIVPRFNAKVTDMIFVAQGNGDDKNENFAVYFEEGMVYFKSDADENFKIDIEKVLEKAKIFDQNALSLGALEDSQEKCKALGNKSNQTTDINNSRFLYSSIKTGQSSAATNVSSQEQQPSPGILERIGNWFKSLLYKLFKILNF